MTIKCPLCTYPEGECSEACMYKAGFAAGKKHSRTVCIDVMHEFKARSTPQSYNDWCRIGALECVEQLDEQDGE